MIATTITLNPRHPAARVETRDLCAMHTRIIDATVAMPDAPGRTLWAQPDPGTLVIRAAEPITAARLPARYATAITHQPWTVPDRPGPWVMNAVVNPARHANIGGPTLNQPNRPRLKAPPRLYDGDDQAAWMQRRIPGAALTAYRAVSVDVARGRHREGRTITVRRVHVRALWHVTDPAAMADRLVAGIGMDKTWGCGLSLWAPAGTVS